MSGKKPEKTSEKQQKTVTAGQKFDYIITNLQTLNTRIDAFHKISSDDNTQLRQEIRDNHKQLQQEIKDSNKQAHRVLQKSVTDLRTETQKYYTNHLQEHAKFKKNVVKTFKILGVILGPSGVLFGLFKIFNFF